MESLIASTSYASRPLFPNYSLINGDITKLVLEFLAKSIPLATFMELARLNKTWKSFMTSDAIFHLIFKTYLASYHHFNVRKDPVKPNDVKNWFSNLHATKCNFNQPRCHFQTTNLDMWPFAATDGTKWIAWVANSHLPEQLWKTNVAELNQPPQEIARFDKTTPLRRIAVLGDTVAAMLSSGKLVIYDVSSDAPRLIQEFELGSSAHHFSLLKNNSIIYRTADGVLFYQSIEKKEPVKLSTIEFNSIEKAPLFLGKIPLVTFENGCYLGLSEKSCKTDRRHYWQLRHIDLKDSLGTFPVTTAPEWKLDVAGEHFAAYNSLARKLLVYRVDSNTKKVQEWHMTFPKDGGNFSADLPIFIKIWGNYLVLAQCSRVKIMQLTPSPGEKFTIVSDRVLQNVGFTIFAGPYISPKGLNFVAVPMDYFPWPGYKPEARLITLSFSPFPSLLSEPLPPPEPPLEPTPSTAARRSERIAKRKRGPQQNE